MVNLLPMMFLAHGEVLMHQLRIDSSDVLRQDSAVYIPTQQERYSKVASITLFLCVIIPSGVVYWLAGGTDLMECSTAFLRTISYPLDLIGFNAAAALCLSAFAQGCAFWWLIRSKRLSPKAKLTIAVTWGMLFALLLKLWIAYYLWRQVTGHL